MMTVFNFANESDARRWPATNDGVMGGISQGQSDITPDGTLRFFGNVSLENNGGFSSIRSLAEERDLSAYDGILIRVRGDGNRYALNLRTDVRIRAGSYRLKFDTEADKWLELFLPFADFRATSFGVELTDTPPLDPRKIRSFGFLISDKQAGPFQLELDWIRADKKPREAAIETGSAKAGCATCVFHMTGVEGCKLAIEIDGRQYLVQGSDIDGHGDAHASDGLCNTARHAQAKGIISGDRFLAEEFRLLP